MLRNCRARGPPADGVQSFATSVDRPEHQTEPRRTARLGAQFAAATRSTAMRTDLRAQRAPQSQRSERSFRRLPPFLLLAQPTGIVPSGPQRQSSERSSEAAGPLLSGDGHQAQRAPQPRSLVKASLLCGPGCGQTSGPALRSHTARSASLPRAAGPLCSLSEQTPGRAHSAIAEHRSASCQGTAPALTQRIDSDPARSAIAEGRSAYCRRQPLLLTQRTDLRPRALRSARARCRHVRRCTRCVSSR